MSSVYVRSSDSEPLVLDVRDSNGAGLAGATGVRARIRRDSDGQFFDWADATYKGAGWTTLDGVAAELDAVNAPGLYGVAGGYPTAAVTNPVVDDHYLVIPANSGAPDTAGAILPPPAEFRVGFWADAVGLDAVVSATIGPEASDTLRLMAWLERQNLAVTAGLVSATIEVRDASGAIVVPTGAMTGPTAQGVFQRDVPGLGLAATANYLAIVTITDAQGAVTGYTAMPTVG